MPVPNFAETISSIGSPFQTTSTSSMLTHIFCIDSEGWFVAMRRSSSPSVKSTTIVFQPSFFGAIGLKNGPISTPRALALSMPSRRIVRRSMAVVPGVLLRRMGRPPGGAAGKSESVRRQAAAVFRGW